METLDTMLEKDITEITPEEIAQLYISTKEDDSLIFQSVRHILREKKPCPSQNSDIKTIAIHTHFRGWLSGHWHAVKDMAEELSDLGYTVYVMHTTPPPQEEMPRDDVKVILLPNYGNNEQSAASTVRAIEDACSTYEIDAVIFNYYVHWIKFIDYLAFKRARSGRTGEPVKCILQFHSSFMSQHLSRGSLGSIWLPNNAKCMALFDALLVEGEVDKRFWSVYNPNCYFRPLPIPYDIFSIDRLPLESHDILCLSRMSFTKNQIELIEAMQYVLAEVPDARLLIAGDAINHYDVDCKQLATELGIESQIIFTGYVRDDAKNELLKNAAIGISASRFEGYSLSLAEMKAHGLPLVLFDIPNATVEDGGEENGSVVVPPHDVKELARQLIRLLKDDALRKELGKRAQDHIRTIYGIDYKAFWEQLFSSLGSERTVEADPIQLRIYELFFQSFNTTRELVERERLRHQEAIEELEAQKGSMQLARLEELTEENQELSQTLAENIKNVPRFERGTTILPAPKKSYTDKYVLFKEAYERKPTVICSLYSSAKAPELGSLSCCVAKVTLEGFIARVFNDSDTDRTPAVSYIAVGL